MASQPQPTPNRSGRGRLFIVSAPSGAGKTTLCRYLMSRLPELSYSVSHTTRPPRPGEKDSRDYYFISEAEFRKGIEENRWAEWAQVYGNYYGTSAEKLSALLAAGRHVLLDIDVQGMRQIRRRFPDAVTIFIMPPSAAVLRERLAQRDSDSETVIAHRLKAAQHEMDARSEYRYVLINDQLEEAKTNLEVLVRGCINENRQSPMAATQSTMPDDDRI